MTFAELLADAKETSWVWEGYVAAGAKTLLVAAPKVGKSTLVFGLLNELLRGSDNYLGVPVATGRVGVIYCTEEASSDAIRSKAERFELDQSNPRALVVKRVKMHGDRWSSIVEKLRQTVVMFREREALDTVLVVIDPLATWAGFVNENDNAETERAIRELDPVADVGAGIIIVHHAGHQDTKSSRRRARGASAIQGAPDILLFLEGTAGARAPRTLLHQGGRLDVAEAPRPLSVVFAAGHLQTFDAGDAQSSRVIIGMWDALHAVSQLGAPTTFEVAEEMRLAGDIGESTVRRYLRELADAGHIERDERMTSGGRETTWKLPDGAPTGLFLGADPRAAKP
jgi:hypothetical protein